MESIGASLAREADEAEARAEAEERGEVTPPAGQRARRRGSEATQVYTVRIPVERLEELRAVASSLDVPPSVLLRKWALERLDQELSRGPKGGSRATAYHSELVDAVSAAAKEAVTQAVRNVLASVPGLQDAIRQGVETAQDRYLDPSGPVRLGATRRLATPISADDIASADVEMEVRTGHV